MNTTHGVDEQNLTSAAGTVHMVQNGYAMRSACGTMRSTASKQSTAKPVDCPNCLVLVRDAEVEALAMDHTPKRVPSLNNVRNLGDDLIHMRASNGQNQITACWKPIDIARGWISNDHITCPECIDRRDRQHAEALHINPRGGYTLIGLGQDLQLHTRYVQD